MCPLYPFHLILLYLCLLLPLLFAVVEGSEELFTSWKIDFIPKSVDQLKEDNSTSVQLRCEDCKIPDNLETLFPSLKLALASDDPKVASVEHELEEGDESAVDIILDLEKLSHGQNSWSFSFNVTGNFLGLTKIRPRIESSTGKLLHTFDDTNTLPVSIIRERDIKSKLFSYSVALLISIAYINMGCALDLQVVKETIRRPVGPIIGFVSQFVAMPLIAFFLGFLFDSAPMRLGLFVTGASPGGGASNIWTLMFGGNLNLSVTMTAISTFSAFFMMPFWIFTLGKLIFSDSDIVIPYYKICTYAFCLVVPLGIGLLIQKYAPKISNFLVRILKPMALFLILFIVIFGIWANLYIFELMTWKVLVTGMCLPWLGFAFGCTIARACNRSVEDVIAIAIETGVQNTGVSIFILWFTLDHPLGDIAAVIPVAAATMTPLPLLSALCIIKLKNFVSSRFMQKLPSEDDVAANDESLEKGDFIQSESSQKLVPEEVKNTIITL